MIKIKLLYKGENHGSVVLWLDGEFQTIYEGKIVGDTDSCLMKVLSLEKEIPFAKVELDNRILQTIKTECLEWIVRGL